MIGDITPTIDRHQLNGFSFQVFNGQQVLGVPSSAQGEDMGVLHQQDLFIPRPSKNLLDSLHLEMLTLPKIHPIEPTKKHRAILAQSWMGWAEPIC